VTVTQITPSMRGEQAITQDAISFASGADFFDGVFGFSTRLLNCF